MGKNTLTDIKAYLYITEPDPDMTELVKEQAIKLEYLNYKCSRHRDDWGVPFGSAGETILNFAAFCLTDKLDCLYEKISDINECAATVIFNPTYDEDGRLRYYTRAFIAKGFIISIHEAAGFDENIFNKRQLDNSCSQLNDRQYRNSLNSPIVDSITMQVRFLVNEIKYLNEGSAGEFSNNILYVNY